MLRRQVIVALVVALAAGGCSRSAAPSRDARFSTSITQLGSSVPTTPGAVGTSANSPSSSSTGALDRRVQAARRAFDAWLQAETTADAATVLANSTGPAAALAEVLYVGGQIVRSRGGTVSTEITRDELRPVQVNNSQVTFAGELETQETITGPGGKQIRRHKFAGPVRVLRQARAWKVSDLTYNDAALVYYPQGREQTVSGVSLNVSGVLSWGHRTTVLVDLRAEDPNVLVDIQRLVLTSESETTRSGKTGFSRDFPAALLNFDRLPDGPDRLDVTLRKRPDTTVQFSLDLKGQRG